MTRASSVTPAAIRNLRELIVQRMHDRNVVSRTFFEREAPRLARVCRLMSDRFEAGGRLLAFGGRAGPSDAQHVAVEFVHPVLAGKRALPALDLSTASGPTLSAMLRPDDIAVGFGPPDGDPDVTARLRQAAAKGVLTLALPGGEGDYAMEAASSDPFIHQEITEIVYHTLWETVHVFFEHRPVGHGAGAAGFLYPFLADLATDTDRVVPEVAASIASKAACDERLRERVAIEQADAIMAAAHHIEARVADGGAVLCFGNGGSATDATDLALDFAASPKGYRPVPAVSLAAEPATITAIANDVGVDAIFVRQLIAHARPQDVAVAISTSGGSANIIGALREARARGLLTIALAGYDGGEILRQQLADHVIVVASDQIPRVQEVQASIYHVLLDLIEAIRRER